MEDKKELAIARIKLNEIAVLVQDNKDLFLDGIDEEILDIIINP